MSLTTFFNVKELFTNLRNAIGILKAGSSWGILKSYRTFFAYKQNLWFLVDTKKHRFNRSVKVGNKLYIQLLRQPLSLAFQVPDQQLVGINFEFFHCRKRGQNVKRVISVQKKNDTAYPVGGNGWTTTNQVDIFLTSYIFLIFKCYIIWILNLIPDSFAATIWNNHSVLWI